MKILYVEDNEDTANAVQRMLVSAGYDVKIAFDGMNGIKMARDTDFDLIILDIMLPDMSGWDIYEKVKDRVRAKVAFLSAIPVSKARLDELKQLGVADYITKPFRKNELVSRVNRIFSG